MEGRIIMTAEKHINRRAFLRATALTAAAALAQACAQPTAQVIEKQVPVEKVVKETVVVEKQVPVEKVVKETVVVQKEVAVEKVVTATPMPLKYKEAPMLADLVAAGKLPPVEERLPPAPEVVDVVDEIGKYGGTMRVAIGNVNSLFGDPQGVMGTELVLRIDKDFASVTGGLFETWEFNKDATQQILNMRKGLKWSDGAPFTTADCLFNWEDIQLNTDIYKAGPSGAWVTGVDKTPMKMEAIDDYTLRLTFADPYPLITLQQCFYSGCQYGGMFAPKHYGMLFHPKYTPQAELDAKVKAAGFENWTQLMGDRMRVGSTIPAQIGLPGLTAFIRTADDPDHHTYERNPYYWKVDPEGNQLPYIDKTVIYIIASRELINTRLIAGELDFAGRNAMLSDLELYQSNLESANLKIIMWDSVYPGRVIFYPNMSAKDPELREFFMKKNVRVALSIGMNRDEINDVVSFGLGEPRQWAMWPNSQYFKPGDEKHYAEYDPKQANALLDQEGYTKKDGDGFRLFPSGNRVGWTIQYDPEQGDIPPTLEVVVQHWQDLGIEVKLKPTNRDLLGQLYDANDLPMTTWEGDISDITWPTAARAVVPGRSNHSWTRPWAAWLWSNGQFPDIEEEPPDWVKATYDDYQQFMVTVDNNERLVIARKMWDRFYEYLPCFSTVGVPQPVVMKTTISNFPDWGIWGFSTIRAVPVHPEQFFFNV